MRGRTNVPQRVRPTVNGDIITANVINSAISVGDFVEHNTILADEALDSSVVVEKPLYVRDVNSTYKLVVTAGYVQLWDKTSLELKSAIAQSYSRKYPCVLSNGDIIVANTSSSSASATGDKSYTFNYFKIVDGELTLLNSTTLSFGVFGAGMEEIDSSHIGLFVLPESGSNITVKVLGFNSTTGVVSSTASKTFDIYNSTYVTFGSSVTKNDIVNRTFKLANNKVLFIISFYDTSVSSDRYRFYAFLLNFASSTYNITLASTLNLSNGKWFDVEKIGNDNVFITTYGRTVSGVTGDHYDSCKVFAVANDTLSLVATYINFINDIRTKTGESSQNSGKIIANLGNGKFLLLAENTNISGYESVVSLAYDSSLAGFTIESALDIKNKRPQFAYYSFLNNIAMPRSGYQLHIGYNATDEELEGMTDISTVKPYAGGRAIGFAKTGGAVGESIQVYIPHQS